MDWKKKTYLICLIGGALTGLITARLMVNEAEAKNDPVRIDFQKGARMGMTILSTIKKII